MASLFDLDTGDFRGNALPLDPIPDGCGIALDDPTPGMNNPTRDGNAWIAGAPIPDRVIPNRAAGWLALIVSPLYQRVYQVGQIYPTIAAELGIFGAAYNTALLNDEQWAGSVAAIINRMGVMINATDEPLTLAEVQWLENWNDINNLGLALEVTHGS